MDSRKNFTQDDEDILNELGVVVDVKNINTLTIREERIVAGFEDIVRFYDNHKREPQLANTSSVFEKIYATRLSSLRELNEARNFLNNYDSHNLLKGQSRSEVKEMSDEDILNELGVDVNAARSITELKYVKPRSHINSADTVATRKKCENFNDYKKLFYEVIVDIKSGARSTPLFKDDATINEGDFFILSGQLLYIEAKGLEFINKYERLDSKLRVIYDNGTETPDMLMRSLQRALNKDKNGRRVDNNNNTSLFSEIKDESDTESGTIYVLRSHSSNPLIVQNRNVIHKIGVTGGDVKKRITNAKYDPTFLMANVEVVATYKLANINRVELEKLIHRFFNDSRMDIEVIDRFGKKVTANEWFMVPLFVIDEMIEILRNGHLSDYYYDKNTAKIIEF